MAKKTASKATTKKTPATKKKVAAKKAVPKKQTAAKKKTAAEKAVPKKKTAAKKNTATKKVATQAAAQKSPPKKVAPQRKAVAALPQSEENLNVVKDFIAALERLDFDAALALCAPNVIWINEPIKSAGSREQLGNVLRSAFGNVSLFRVEDLQIGEDPDGTVYTDRIDIIEGGGMSMRIRVKGVFNVQDGQISSWADSFNWLEGTRQVLRCAPSILKFQLGKLRKRRG